MCTCMRMRMRLPTCTLGHPRPIRLLRLLRLLPIPIPILIPIATVTLWRQCILIPFKLEEKETREQKILALLLRPTCTWNNPCPLLFRRHHHHHHHHHHRHHHRCRKWLLNLIHTPIILPNIEDH